METSTVALSLLLAALVGWLVTFWRYHLRVRAQQIAEREAGIAAALLVEKEEEFDKLCLRNDKLEADKQALQEKFQEATNDLSECKVNLRNVELEIGEKSENLQALRQNFKTAANEICLQVMRTAQQEASSGINSIISPFKTNFAQEAKSLKELVKETVTNFSLRTEQLGGTAAEAVTTARDASEKVIRLTKMLRGDVQRRGHWGEIQLERVLEASGLEKNVGYQTQVAVGETTSRRADCLFCYPDNKRMIIDAKVSLEHYDKWLNSEDRNDRDKAQGEFSRSIKAQVDDLAKKKYPKLYREEGNDVLDCVIMFVPNEAALGLAMQDQDLWYYAMQRNIIFAGPSTLLLMANSLYQVWQYAKQNESTDKAMKLADGILGKIEGFIEATEKIGTSLTKAQDAYLGAEKILFSGRGSLRSKCEKLQDLGLHKPRIKAVEADKVTQSLTKKISATEQQPPNGKLIADKEKKDVPVSSI